MARTAIHTSVKNISARRNAAAVKNLRIVGPNRKVDFSQTSAVSRGNVVQANKNYAACARIRHGNTELGDRLVAYFEGLNEDIHKEEYAAARKELITAMKNQDKESISAFREIMSEMTTNIVLASSNLLPFFQTRTLAHNDRASIKNETHREISVMSVGADGKADQTRAVLQNDEAFITMIRIATELYEYPLFDLDSGFDVRDAALAQVDLGRDLAFQVDSLLAQFILVGAPNTQLTATFQTTGPEVNRDYHAHSRVNTANFPVGNLLTATGNGATTNPRIAVLRAILDYTRAWGTNAFPDGDIVPVSILVPSSDINGFLDEVTTIDVQDNKLSQEIITAGVPASYGGQRFNFIPDNTLSPDDGMCYVQTNKKIGYFFEKPDLDQTLTDDSFERRAANSEAVTQTKVLGIGASRHQRPNLIGVRYRTPA